jgi:hypothetical protein
MQRVLDTSRAELNLAWHANAARDEMQQLADEFRALAHPSGMPTLRWNGSMRISILPRRQSSEARRTFHWIGAACGWD